jgi:hypothetical protein
MCGSAPTPRSAIRTMAAAEPQVAASNPAIGATMSKQARITGLVEYREGDGANITIRQGLCEVQESALDVTLSWTDADSHGSAAIPLADFKRYVASHAIQMVAAKE